MEIIERIFKAMENKNIKMADLSRELDISRSVVTSWKTRKNNPPSEYIARICNFIGEDIVYILTGQKEANVFKLTQEQQYIVEMYNQLNEKNKGKAEMFLEQKIEEQQKENNSKDSAHFTNLKSS